MRHDHAQMRRNAIDQHSEKIHRIQRAHRAGGGHADAAQDRAIITKAVIKGVHEHEKNDHPGHPLTKLHLRDGGHAEGHSGRKRMDRQRRAAGGKVDAIYRNRNGGEGASNDGKGRDASGEKDAARMHAEQKRDVDAYARNRLASGGRARGGHGKASHVNVIVAPGQGPARPVPVPVPAAGMGASAPPPRPPMSPGAAPMAGGPPMGGAAPMMPRPGMGAPIAGGVRKDGGRAWRASGGSVEREAGEPHPPFRDMPNMHAGARSGIGRLEKTKSARRPHSEAIAGD